MSIDERDNLTNNEQSTKVNHDKIDYSPETTIELMLRSLRNDMMTNEHERAHGDAITFLAGLHCGLMINKREQK